MSDEKMVENAPVDPMVESPRQNVPIDRHAIREMRTYMDDKGREVKEFIQVFGKSKEANIYKGCAVVQVRATNPQGIPLPPRNQHFEFNIEAAGVKSAFENFDASAEAELDRMRQAKKDENRIKVGDKRIIGPGGRPIRV